MECANGFSVTRPSLNQSFTIRHAVSLPLRRHSRTASAGNVSLTSFETGIPRTWKFRESCARAVDARSTLLIMDII